MKNENQVGESAGLEVREDGSVVSESHVLNSRRRREPIIWKGIRLGTGEIIGLSIATLLLLIALVAYFNFLRPARNRLAEMESENARMQRQLRDATEGVTRGQNAQATVAEILQSLNDFEASYLPARSEGRTSVIEELNNLIRQNSLRISGTTNYAPLETVGSGGTVSRPRDAAANVFPGIGITLTVEGDYGNLRRFIRDIEASRQFIVINAVELERVSSESVAGGTGGNAVSLRLNLAAYFRRDDFGSGNTEAVAPVENESPRLN
jgi:Tfp pilus assembly protein PilO